MTSAHVWLRASRLASIAAAVSLTVVAATGAVLAWAANRDVPPAFAPGDALPAAVTAALPASRTLVIFLDEACAVSRESVATYARLVSGARSAGDTSVRIVTEIADADRGRQLAGDLGIGADEIVRGAPGAMGLRIVPTAVLTGADGRVERSWEGRPDGLAEAAMRRALQDTIKERE
ncbi:MAG: hypothetical protein R2752_09640 [Vicinamibacterales bacterium]